MHPDRHARSKVQAAMEYLMTYGWAIVIIAVVVMIIYEMKLSSPSLPTSCLSTEPWLCRNPTLRTNGILSVQLGILGSTITIIDLNCSPSGVMPSSWTTPSPATLVSGVPVILNFSCPISSNTVGTSFAGRLWIIYNTPTQTGLIAQVGSVSAQAVGVGIPSNVVASPFYFLTMSSNPSAAAASLSPGTGYYTGTLTISASANPGYTFSSWTGTGTGSYAGNALSNTIMLSNNVTETANFVPLPFQFSANVITGGGTVSCASTGAVNALCQPINYLCGNTVTVYANAGTANFLSWSGCSGPWCSATGNVATVQIPAFNAVINAGFSAPTIVLLSQVGSGNWLAPSGVSTIYLLVVAGGGGGGAYSSSWTGGGGGGGVVQDTAYPVTPGNSYPYTVGAGGAEGTTSVGANGYNSVFGSGGSAITAIGGGGGNIGESNGAAGGSGGGAGGGNGSNVDGGTGGAASQPTSGTNDGGVGYGNSGGGQPGHGQGGGGGGGAGAGGNNGSGSQGGAGGAGVLSSVTGSYYGGGGGGECESSSCTPPSGGAGGGGAGGSYGAVGTAGTANT